MLKLKLIQWKALSLLILFTANFSVVCHCSANAAPVISSHRNRCCESQAREGRKNTNHRSCDDKGGCPATHALKFNLLEKQVAASVHSGPLFAALITNPLFVPASIALPTIGRERPCRCQHSPPNLQVLYQRFLI